MSTFDDASLVFIPSGYKTSKAYSVKPSDGSGDLAFTRSNDTATRVGPDGLIEKVRTNLILQSETFNNASWTKDSATITANTTTAPDGTTTADTLTISDSQYIYQSITLTAGVSYTISLYVRVASGTNQFKFNTFGSSNTFISSTQTATTAWQRFSFTFTAVGSGSTAIYPLIVDGLAGGSFFIWGAQVETTDFGATPYIATTTAAVSVGPVANVPRLDYLNSSCPRLLLEPQRSNLALFSESFDNAAWTKSNSTITANAAVSPDGTTSADKIVEAATTSGHSAYEAISVTNGATYTLSVFAKAAERTRVWVDLYGGTNAAVFDLTTGTILATSGGSTSKIENYGNGWYRCSVTSTAPDPTLYINVGPTTGNTTNNSYAGTAGNGIYAWGAQLEAGAYATSYIPTLGASVTRGADAASKTGISSLIGQTEGTMFAEFTYNGVANSGVYEIILELATDANNVITINKNNITSQLYVFAQVGGVIQVNSVGIAGTNILGTHKVAFGYKLNDYVVYLDGVQVFTDTSATVPTCSGLFVGQTVSNTAQLGGGINQALLFKTRLSNADLAALTA